jgi:hypothetical protein
LNEVVKCVLIKTLGNCSFVFQPGVGTVTCIAFKNDQIVQGDVEGMLNIWDLKARTSRNIHTGRGWIKKMRFAPGKGNLKLLILYSDGVDIVDLKKVLLMLTKGRKLTV